jgi:hypothetical protein
VCALIFQVARNARMSSVSSWSIMTYPRPAENSFRRLVICRYFFLVPAAALVIKENLGGVVPQYVRDGDDGTTSMRLGT